ncbi:DUF192 domain-containing protein [Novosphingobium colocasiae]|uniref:DUF192 domain-containing protein n=1 Tax=Novosphingobium colocasiae TaxID=1256513 RepID=A0A918UDZ0_9SPHN|nr:DUF192 domain-containing protein [Novosphingobium colocasiae]GGY94291.1 hypothetical protein GCM10011614_06630 [Novosphingobium colocasiae]
MRLKHPLAALALLAAVACSQGPQEAAATPPVSAAPSADAAAPSVHPDSGLRVIPLTVRSAGGVHTFRVELAGTSAEQARGLMFRSRMGADEGMIFPMNPPRVPSFWMHNTVLPLDIVFIGEDGRILNIAHGKPYDESLLSAAGFAIGVLELNAGRAAELGIVPGDVVQW